MTDSEKIIKLLENQGKKLDEIIKLLSSPQGKTKFAKKTTSKPTSKISVFGLIEEFKQDNFFDKPKSLKEIQKELQKLNYHYATTSLTNPLQRLVRQRVLGRILQKGRWVYVKR